MNNTLEMMKPLGKKPYTVEARLYRGNSQDGTDYPLQIIVPKETGNKLCNEVETGEAFYNSSFFHPLRTPLADKTKGADGEDIFYIKPEFSKKIYWDYKALPLAGNYNPRYFSSQKESDAFVESIKKNRRGVYGHEIVLRPLADDNTKVVSIDLEYIMNRLSNQIKFDNISEKKILRSPISRLLSADDIVNKLRKGRRVGHLNKVDLGHIKDHPEILISIFLQFNEQLYSKINSKNRPDHFMEIKGKKSTITIPTDRGKQLTYTPINSEGRKAELRTNVPLPQLQVVLSLTHYDQRPCFDDETLKLIAQIQKNISELLEIE